MRVTKGLVYKVEFYFPVGSAGLMGVAVFDGSYQVWPSTVGEFFVGQDQLIAFDDLYSKDSAPYELSCYSYNLDDTYEHMVSVRIGLVSKAAYIARFLPTQGYEYLEQLLSKLAEEKAELAKMQKRQAAETAVKQIAGGKKEK